jgi:hypothetical protein
MGGGGRGGTLRNVPGRTQPVEISLRVSPLFSAYRHAASLHEQPVIIGKKISFNPKGAFRSHET